MIPDTVRVYYWCSTAACVSKRMTIDDVVVRPRGVFACFCVIATLNATFLHTVPLSVLLERLLYSFQCSSMMLTVPLSVLRACLLYPFQCSSNVYYTPFSAHTPFSARVFFVPLLVLLECFLYPFECFSNAYCKPSQCPSNACCTPLSASRTLTVPHSALPDDAYCTLFRCVSFFASMSSLILDVWPCMCVTRLGRLAVLHRCTRMADLGLYGGGAQGMYLFLPTTPQ